MRRARSNLPGFTSSRVATISGGSAPCSAECVSSPPNDIRLNIRLEFLPNSVRVKPGEAAVDLMFLSAAMHLR